LVDLGYFQATTNYLTGSVPAELMQLPVLQNVEVSGELVIPISNHMI
jgi:hypothetical protein